ncbi:helix-turn-helix domain-containing protein [Rummeliibacillus stabekisii]|uniref:helix-turn-helix domain-containing protein n=1 Tax=Rummeliibacillus stabekisii TaxID=241244 RepID=UPI0037184E09
MVGIGCRIKNLRKHSGLSINELSAILYCSNTQLFFWEEGLKEIPIEILKAISKYFDIELEWILTGEDLHGYLLS